MSYRYRLASVPTAVVNQVKDMTPEKLKDWVIQNNPEGWEEDDDNGFFNHYLLLGQNEFFDFGNDCDFTCELTKRGKPLFTKSETIQAMEPIIVCTKDDFAFIIEGFRKRIENYFQNCFESYSPEQMKLYFENKKQKWSNITETLGITSLETEKAKLINAQHYPYNMNEDSDTVVQSWLYEYAIFELVRLYKTFKWEENTLLFYGW